MEKRDWKFYRAERYRLQSIVREWFCQEGQKQGLEYPANYNKTAKCLYTRYQDEVDIAKIQDTSFYIGLIKCLRIWTCPVCAMQIQAKRKKQVEKLVHWAYSQGYKCIMVTFTFPHYRFQIADDLMNRFSKALRYFRTGKLWQYCKKKIGMVGLLRGLEITRTKNGWHIHTHEIWVVDKKTQVDEITILLKMRWEEAVKRQGLLPEDRIESFRLHGVNVRDNAKSADYLLKSAWGIERELTLQDCKDGGSTPFDLVREGRKKEFLEYARAFKGRLQMCWSGGLKKKAGIGEENESEDGIKESTDILGFLSPSEWRLIVSFDVRAKILEIAESDGLLGVKQFLYKLEKQEAENGGLHRGHAS